ncbi:ABC transporter permease [Bacillus sp. AFS017336]|uniref:ABC transporter permease n=1 Tax=Bacillus sp. AFS017336 TaxID=2033489 RepID=UPI000BF068AF|nr:ABC transporter permease subunit [Bacillus sp. AFS017336]PEL13692.1 ABC transporter permease [Bacillus sp. AFS017336]
MYILVGNVLNETQKLFLKKKTIVSLLLIALISFLPAFFISSIKQKLIFIAMDSIDYPSIILSILTNLLLPLFIFMVSAELFSGEVADGTMKLVLIRPISRLKVFISKNIAIAFYIISCLVMALLVSIISSMILKLHIDHTLYVISAYFVDVIPAVVFMVFATFVVQFFKSSSTALISGILVYIGIQILTLFISGLNNILFTNYLNWSHEWLSSGTLLFNLNHFFMLLGYMIVFFIIGYYFFDKQEY